MRPVYQRFTIVKSTKPAKKNINDKLQWFGISLGLFTLRDKNKSSFRIFIELLKAAKVGHGLTSDELGEKLRLSRGTVVHHLNKLSEAGLVAIEKNHYHLRVENLEQLVDEIEKDLERTWADLHEVAKEIDSWLNL
ncbi:MAG: winged helix-turn-helix domain-containing protein [Candidatus Woesearchaeota archaeon]